MSERDESGAIAGLEGGTRLDGATLAVGLAAAAALAVGAAAGVPVAMAASVGGAIAVVVGGQRVVVPDPVTRATGSVGLVLGAVIAVPAIASTGDPLAFLLLACGAGGVLVVGMGTVGRTDPGSFWVPLYSLAGSAAVALLAGVLPIVAVGVVALAVGALTGGDPSGVVPANPLLALVFLQVEVVAVSIAIERATAVLETWVRRPDRGVPVLERLGVEASAIPRSFWAFLGVQVLLAPFVGPGIAGILTATPPGEVVYGLLVGGTVHAVLAVALLAFVAVPVAEGIRRVIAGIGGYHPPTVLGLLGGGIVAAAVAFALALVAPGRDALGATLGSTPVSVQPFGPATNALWTVGVRAGLALAFLGIVSWYLAVLVERDDTAVFIGAGLLFAMAVVGSEAGAHPVAVFATVGAALLVADVGSRSLGLDRALGRSADLGEVETVHAVGNVAAVAVGVVLAAAALYVVVPATRGLAGPRSVLLVLAALVALLAFLLLLGRDAPAGE
mgnify:CR=1 FL=1